MDSSWPRYGARAQMSSHTAFSRSHSFLPSISCLSTCSWWWVRGYNCSPFLPWRDKRRTSVMRFHSYSSAFLSATSCASLASLFAASSASFSFASWAFCSASANASSRSWVSMMLVHELRQQPVSRTAHHTQAQAINELEHVLGAILLVTEFCLFLPVPCAERFLLHHSLRHLGGFHQLRVLEAESVPLLSRELPVSIRVGGLKNLLQFWTDALCVVHHA